MKVLLPLLVISVFIACQTEANTASPPALPPSKAKLKAFDLLTAKCNVCHLKQNRRKVFTLENMDGFGAQIHTQVFVKKRMPKGNKITLTQTDYLILKNWLNTID